MIQTHRSHGHGIAVMRVDEHHPRSNETRVKRTARSRGHRVGPSSPLRIASNCAAHLPCQLFRCSPHGGHHHSTSGCKLKEPATQGVAAWRGSGDENREGPHTRSRPPKDTVAKNMPGRANGLAGQSVGPPPPFPHPSLPSPPLSSSVQYPAFISRLRLPVFASDEVCGVVAQLAAGGRARPHATSDSSMSWRHLNLFCFSGPTSIALLDTFASAKKTPKKKTRRVQVHD